MLRKKLIAIFLLGVFSIVLTHESIVHHHHDNAETHNDHCSDGNCETEIDNQESDLIHLLSHLVHFDTNHSDSDCVYQLNQIEKVKVKSYVVINIIKIELEIPVSNSPPMDEFVTEKNPHSFLTSYSFRGPPSFLV